ncbi:hypothetical protein PVAND_001031 [Polypedilum vanderplanki]|uniref:E3 ubiquitin-protein ligase n=1 Tax=Polypedilum vanderplanki TaxID=319348 RepID=A0A9J6BM44_POLVA|nr:hypothetical protein PVAND_001031 [Polypedilum vanderplanki]
MNPIGSSTTQQLLQGLKSNEESQQLQALIEICTILVMGNEETLVGFPIIQTIPSLINLLQKEENFDLMNHACRALTYMLEALPRSSILIIDAIPALLWKLQEIQCIDVAEQSLIALEILSRRHFKAILYGNGISICLSFLDFFSVTSQNAALTIVSNCCLNLKVQEFNFFRGSISLLTQILSKNDNKNLEQVCNIFCRLTEGFKDNSVILQEIGSTELMKNCQKLLVASPSVLNNGTFTNVIKMMSNLCASCPDLVKFLLENDIVSNLLFLLTNPTNISSKIELVQRNSTELNEIMRLIVELLPKLPNEGILEAEKDDFIATTSDENRSSIENFIKLLISVLFEVYSFSSTPFVRYKCLQALLRMIHFANADLLKEVLNRQFVSSNIAGMIASNDNKIIIEALKMAEILMQKLPDVFGNYFQREGVMHYIQKLVDSIELKSQKDNSTTEENFESGNLKLENSSRKLNSQTSIESKDKEIVNIDSKEKEKMVSESKKEEVTLIEPKNLENSSIELKVTKLETEDQKVSISESKNNEVTSIEPTNQSESAIEDLNSDDDFEDDSMSENTIYDSFNSSSSSSSSYESVKNADEIPMLNTSRINQNASKISQIEIENENSRQWIKNKAISFINRYSNDCINSNLTIMSSLAAAIKKLDGSHDDCINGMEELKNILLESDISSFEFNQSGLINAMLNFMTKEEGKIFRDDRLRLFLNIFTNLPIDTNYNHEISINPTAFSSLVSKLNLCLTRLEEFTIKVYDYRSNVNPIKFFTTHQLNVNIQKHPECTNVGKFKDGVVKIAPLAQIELFEKYLESENEENLEPRIIADGRKRKFQFFINNQLVENSMTIYQAIKENSPAVNGESRTENCIGSVNIWLQQHTILYKVIEEKFEAQSTSCSEAKPDLTSAELSTRNLVPTIISPLNKYLDTKFLETIKDSSVGVLTLLRVLNGLNRYWSSLYSSLKQTQIIDQAEFINSKISTKVIRQLQDPLIIMTGSLPNWLKDLAISCPFLFPFETRHLLFYVTSFDRDRALQRVIDTTPDLISKREILPRLNRQKCEISRKNILKHAEFIMKKFGNSKSLLEIQYENEVGTGLGPTLEFYALVSNELQRSDLNLWNDAENSYRNQEIKENFAIIPAILVYDENSHLIFEDLMIKIDGIDRDEKLEIKKIDKINPEDSRLKQHRNIQYVNSPNGLFPVALNKATRLSKIKSRFNFLGKFMAKSVLDSRMIDLPLSMPFYRWILNEQISFDLFDLEKVAPEVHNVLLRLNEIVKQREIIQENSSLNNQEKAAKIEALNLDGCQISDLSLNFVLPGHPNIELLENGQNIPVTIYNLHEYISLVSHWFLVKGVTEQFESFKEGFNSIFSIETLKLFYPEELENVFCGSGNFQKWNTKMLAECCRTDHGFTQESIVIQNFYDILSQFNREEQRSFLQFITGTPKLPVGGFKSLIPPLTIVAKKIDENQNPDDFLPSVMTCVNYLKLPEYSNREIMKEKLKIAANEGSLSFHLS